MTITITDYANVKHAYDDRYTLMKHDSPVSLKAMYHSLSSTSVHTTLVMSHVALSPVALLKLKAICLVPNEVTSRLVFFESFLDL